MLSASKVGKPEIVSLALISIERLSLLLSAEKEGKVVSALKLPLTTSTDTIELGKTRYRLD